MTASKYDFVIPSFLFIVFKVNILYYININNRFPPNKAIDKGMTEHSN